MELNFGLAHDNGSLLKPTSNSNQSIHDGVENLLDELNLSFQNELNNALLRLKFSVGKHLVFADLLYKEQDQNPESKKDLLEEFLEKFFQEEHIPIYLHSSIYCSIYALLKEEKEQCFHESISINDSFFFLKRAEKLSNLYKLIEKLKVPVTQPQSSNQSVSFSEAYQFLYDITAVRGNLIQFETDYAKAMRELRRNKRAAINDLSKRYKNIFSNF